MGRIKTDFIKRITKELLDIHSDKFTDDFEKNKEIVNGLITPNPKKLRNIIAGHITKLVRKKTKE